MLEAVIENNDKLLYQVSKVHDYLKYKVPAHPVENLLLPYKSADDPETKLLNQISFQQY